MSDDVRLWLMAMTIFLGATLAFVGIMCGIGAAVFGAAALLGW